MKKLSSIIALSLVFTLVLGMTAFADGPSPDAGKFSGGKVELPEDLDCTVAEVPSAIQNNALAEVSNPDSDIWAEADIPDSIVIDLSKPPVVKAAFDFSIAPGEDMPASITVDPVGTIDSSKTYIALHLHQGVWEVVNLAVRNGKFVLSGYSSLSPFVIMELTIKYSANHPSNTDVVLGDGTSSDKFDDIYDGEFNEDYSPSSGIVSEKGAIWVASFTVTGKLSADHLDVNVDGWDDDYSNEYVFVAYHTQKTKAQSEWSDIHCHDVVMTSKNAFRILNVEKLSSGGESQFQIWAFYKAGPAPATVESVTTGVDAAPFGTDVATYGDRDDADDLYDEMLDMAKSQGYDEAHGWYVVWAVDLVGTLPKNQKVTLSLPSSETDHIIDGEANEYVAFHFWYDNGRHIEKLDCTVAQSGRNGRLTINGITHFSPFMIMYRVKQNVEGSAGAASASTTTTPAAATNATVTSPKTGETVPYAVVVALAAVAGVSVIGAKRRFANR